MSHVTLYFLLAWPVCLGSNFPWWWNRETNHLNPFLTPKFVHSTFSKLWELKCAKFQPVWIEPGHKNIRSKAVASHHAMNPTCNSHGFCSAGNLVEKLCRSNETWTIKTPPWIVPPINLSQSQCFHSNRWFGFYADWKEINAVDFVCIFHCQNTIYSSHGCAFPCLCLTLAFEPTLPLLRWCSNWTSSSGKKGVAPGTAFMMWMFHVFWFFVERKLSTSQKIYWRLKHFCPMSWFTFPSANCFAQKWML